MPNYRAHSQNSLQRFHDLLEHLSEVARLAAEHASHFGGASVAGWTGWWHDSGKVRPDFQDYLQSPDEKLRGPDHSSVGALHAWNLKSDLRLLAFCLAGHHGGLPNLVDLKARMKRKLADTEIRRALDQASRFLEHRSPPPSASELPDFFRQNSRQGRDAASRRVAFFLRMLHSALVDADCLDTERHFDPERSSLREGSLPLEPLWGRLSRAVDELISDSPGTAVNLVRAKVYGTCIDAASRKPGFFSLTVPTGGGKTLSGMAFALRHAIEHGLRRVVVAIPFTTIIEQNADVYRRLFGEGAVLEHHSSAGSGADRYDEGPEERWRRLAAQNWDAPIVVTTNVQFFESLFASRNGRIRKLHNLAKSVVILDEAQTLPEHLLAPTLEALEILVSDFGSTVIFSTATQPAFQSLPGAQAARDSREIVPECQALFSRLRRVTYELPAPDTRWTWRDLAGKVMRHESALVVLNRKRDAMDLLDTLQEQGVPESRLLHLSTQLCAAHRRRVLARVRRRLESGEPCLLVSTQVVEAGVDLDFPVVYRALGPLDRIVQAAGRCNREGRHGQGRVIVFEPAEGGSPPGRYRTGMDVTRGLFREPELDLHDPAVYGRYFQRYYGSLELDEKRILEDLAHLNFETVGKNYRIIENQGESVVVPDLEEGDRIEGLLDEARRWGRPSRELMRRLQPYLVGLYSWTFKEAAAQRLLMEIVPGLYRWLGRYDEMRGLQMESVEPEDLVI